MTHALREGAFLLGGAGVSALKRMIEGPARAAGLSVEPALVDRILNDAGSEPGALALVEFMLEQLYDTKSGNVLTLASYETLGGIAGAIEARGERAARDSGIKDPQMFNRVFRALAGVDEESGAVRKRAPLSAFDGSARALVERLAAPDTRLLVTNKDTDGDKEAFVEVAHEAVLRHWRRLRQWLSDNRALELWRQRLSTYKRDGAVLPRGAPLTTALDWLKRRPDGFEPDETQYIVASRNAARWFYGLIWGSAAAALLAVSAVGAFTVASAKWGLSNEATLTVMLHRVGLRVVDVQEPDMADIPAGEFMMVSSQNETDRRDSEGPPHKVKFAHAFKLSRYELSFVEYDAYAAATGRGPPSDEGWRRTDRPAIFVSWDDAVAYAKWLSLMTGKRYRLPTEAEWEYAARAGSTTRFWWGDEVGENNANCADCRSEWDGAQTAPVGSFKANDFGIYDTSGNVFEWTQDCWHDDYTNAPSDGSAGLEENDGNCGRRVVRGGSWDFGSDWSRSANRNRNTVGNRNNNVGFRLAQSAHARSVRSAPHATP